MKICKTEQEFIDAVTLAAQKACVKYNTMLPSVVIAQSALENGFAIRSYWDNPGVEDLLKNNNMVGQKRFLLNDSWSDHFVWDGKSYFTKETPEVVNGKYITKKDDFRIFNSIEDSFCDYIAFLLYASNEGKGGKAKYGREVTDIKDPEKLIKTINAKGYASNTEYWKKIVNIINRHNLTKYDNPEEDIKMAEKVDTITIIDRTAYNTPAKWGNTGQALVFHFLGVASADNPNLYSSNGSGAHYGGQWYIYRDGRIVHAVKEGGTVWAVGSGGWGLKTTKWNNGNTESVEMGCECDGDKNSIYDKKWWFHMATQEAAVKFARYWLEYKGYGVSEKTVNERILVHNSITNKPCPAPWLHGAGYKSSKESGHVNWSFEEFKKKIWQGYTGKTKAVFTGGSGGQSSNNNSTTRNYLMKGDKSEAVRTMQKMLLALGYDLGKWGADSDFGSATDTALRAFQKDHNLTVDGKYGNNTKAALEAAYKNLAITIKRGDKGDAVKTMQQMLIACKCLAEGEADGDFGPKTEAAVKMAQYILLGADKQTGIYDATTKAAVEKCYAKVVDTRFIYKDTNFAFVFDPEYYNNRYADLNEHYHGDVTKLFNHFLKYGTSINEKRQGCADFNVEVYAKNYPELLDHYKNDWFMLYRHYCKHGWHEGRKGV